MSQSSTENPHQKVCDCGNGAFFFVKDLNLDKAWKAGNKFCRICTDCGNRYFLSKKMYQAASDKYVILDGDDSPVPVFECPACEEEVTGMPDTCPYCDVEYQWADDEDEDDEEDDEEETDPDEAAEADAEDEDDDSE